MHLDERTKMSFLQIAGRHGEWFFRHPDAHTKKSFSFLYPNGHFDEEIFYSLLNDWYLFHSRSPAPLWWQRGLFIFINNYL